MQASDRVRQYSTNSRIFASGDISFDFIHWWQAIAVPQALSVSFTNSRDASPNLPFALGNSPGLQDLHWAGQTTQLQQLERIQGDVLSRLTNLSLYLHQSEDYFLNNGESIQNLSHGVRAFAQLHQLRSLSIRNYTPSATGLLEIFLPLTR